MENFRKLLKEIFQQNIFEDDDPLDFGPIDPTYVEPKITDIEPEPQLRKPVINLSVVPLSMRKAKNPPYKFMGQQVLDEIRTEEDFQKALRIKKQLNSLYSNIKDSLTNYYKEKINNIVDPQHLEISAEDKKQGIKYRDAFLKNFKIVGGYRDEGLSFKDVLHDMITIDIDKLLSEKMKDSSKQDLISWLVNKGIDFDTYEMFSHDIEKRMRAKKEHPSLNEIQPWLKQLGIDHDTFRNNLVNDLVTRLANSKEFEAFKKKFQRRKSAQKRSAQSNIIKKARQKVELASKELDDIIEQLPPEIKKHSDFEAFRRFSLEIPNKIEKINNQYRNSKSKEDFEKYRMKFENLLATIEQHISILRNIADNQAAE